MMNHGEQGLFPKKSPTSLNSNEVTEDEINEHDILFGREGGSRNTGAILTYQEKIEAHVEEYASLESRGEKIEVALKIVRELRQDGVRFLKRVNNEEVNGKSVWEDTGDLEFRKNVSRELRELTKAFKLQQQSQQKANTSDLKANLKEVKEKVTTELKAQVTESTPAECQATTVKGDQRSRSTAEKAMVLKLRSIPQEEIHACDVLLTRGGRAIPHPGNARYLQILKGRLQEVVSQNNNAVVVYLEKIVRCLRNDGVRFLRRDQGGSKLWNDVGDAYMANKVRQNFREYFMQEKLKTSRKKTMAKERALAGLKTHGMPFAAIMPVKSDEEEDETAASNGPKAAATKLKPDVERPQCVICSDDSDAEYYVAFSQEDTVLKCGGGPHPTNNEHVAQIRHHVGTDVLLCGHAVHDNCMAVYLAKIHQPKNDWAIGSNGDFRCPLCQRFGNCLVPVAEASPLQKHLRKMPSNLSTDRSVGDTAQTISPSFDGNFLETEQIYNSDWTNIIGNESAKHEATSLPQHSIAKNDGSGVVDSLPSSHEAADTSTTQSRSAASNTSWSLCDDSQSPARTTIATWDAFDSIANDDPSLWAISYDQLMSLHQVAQTHYGDNFQTVTMRDICRDLIEPLCRKHETSFALYHNPGGLMVEAFISHSWDEPFNGFVDSIEKVFQTFLTKPNLWICALALIQGVSDDFMKEQLGLDVDYGIDATPFVLALKSAKYFVVVRNPVTDLYSQIWCVCELLFAKKVGLVPRSTFVTGSDSFSNLRTSCIDAQATNKDDKARILRVLLTDHNDYKEIDDFVYQFRCQHAPR